jgi:NAD(P)-dependent dehydrogenase (short-subunit alcohol dehydrogenase family)
MTTRLKDKVAIVTGAARGQGRAAALRLAEDGATVALTDLLADELEDAVASVRAAGGSAIGVPGDITDPQVLEGLVAETLAAFGRVDVLFNNAGIAISSTLDGYSVADFDRLMHVNCLAQMLAIQQVLPHMRERGGGSIINVASIGALVALPHLAAYCASKAAVIGLTRAVAYEVAGDGIRCNAICPGGVDTPMARAVVDSFDDEEQARSLLVGRQLFKRFAQPREIAELVVFLASDESSFITGATLPIEAGHSAW